jgi:hypothetical protein
MALTLSQGQFLWPICNPWGPSQRCYKKLKIRHFDEIPLPQNESKH